MKYIYNTTDIYTLLFKRGTIEIKAGTYYVAPDYEYEDGTFAESEKSGQVKIFDKLEDIPVKKAAAITQEETPDPMLGLTEDQFKKERELNPQTPKSSGGTVTKLGSGSNSGLTEEQLKAKLEAESKPGPAPVIESETTAEVITETPVESDKPIEPTEETAGRGRKAKKTESK